MEPGTIIILNGASSSGKTTILRALQSALQEPYLEAGIDKFIWMLPKRYLDRPLWDDVLGKATEAGQMGEKLVSGMHHSIAALSHAGLNVLADHVLVEKSWVDEAAALFHNLPVWLVGVHCPLGVLVERERSRKDRTLGQAAAQFPLIHAHCIYDFTVDTSLLSVEECCQKILFETKSRSPSRAVKALEARKRIL